MRLSIACFVICAALGTQVGADDWPQWMGPNRDSLWHEPGVLVDFAAGAPKVLWRKNIGGGYAGPAVVGDRVYVTDYLTEGDTSPNPGVRNELQGTERVLCLDAATGETVWKLEYDCPYQISYPAGPRCTPTIAGGKLYALGAEGNLFCLDPATGDKLWSRELKKDYKTDAPHWGFSSHPLVDGQTLFCVVGGKGSVAVAFDKDSGKELWKNLSANSPGYSPPTLIEAGGQKQLVIFHSESVNGLDPQTGKKLWSVPIVTDFQMPIMAPRQSGDLLYVSGVGAKSVLLKLSGDKPEEVWRGTQQTSIYSICSTPVIDGDVMYGVCSGGELRAAELKTGKRLWETLAATTGKRPQNSGTAFLVKNTKVNRWYLMSETGKLFIADLSPKKFTMLGETQVLEPTTDAFGRLVVWSHPAFANRCMYARNDKEIVCLSLSAEGSVGRVP